jgi:hypothetical protein
MHDYGEGHAGDGERLSPSGERRTVAAAGGGNAAIDAAAERFLYFPAG